MIDRTACYVISCCVLGVIIALVGWYVYLKVKGTAGCEKFTSDYEVHEFPHFLTDEECEAVIALSKRRGLEPSRVYSKDADLLEPDMRVSEQVWLSDGDEAVIAAISKRAADLTKVPESHQEQLQVVHYDAGGKFTPHYDACDDKPEVCARLDERGGQRLATLLIYLNDDFEGGGTNFVKLNKTVVPEKGKAVLFYNVDPKNNNEIIRDSMHEGAPVKSGEKWIANKWVRVRPL